eukprot:6426965-Amphidinium_carterae.1
MVCFVQQQVQTTWETTVNDGYSEVFFAAQFESKCEQFAIVWRPGDEASVTKPGNSRRVLVGSLDANCLARRAGSSAGAHLARER